MEDPLKIAICEDTKEDEQKLLEILKTCSIPSNCVVFRSGEELLQNYKPETFDLLLSDIYMNGMSGIDAVKKIREIDEDIPVAFITTSTEHTLESYRLSALKYIEKPFSQKEIEDILKLAEMNRMNAPSLTVGKNGKFERIPFSHILYIEQQTHRLFIYLKNGSFEDVYEKLSNILPQLEEAEFFQPHKSFSVNLNFVKSINTELKCFVMQDDKNVPICREKMGKAKKELESFLFRKTREL